MTPHEEQQLNDLAAGAASAFDPPEARSGLPVIRSTADTVMLFDIHTGEIVHPCDATTDTLAAIRDELRDYDETAKIAKQTIDHELLARMDRAGEWTAYVGGYKLTAPSPAPAVEYNAEQLIERLQSLANEGLIDIQVVGEAVKTETILQPVRAKLNKLRKLGGKVAAAIDECAVEIDKPRRVSVKRGS